MVAPFLSTSLQFSLRIKDQNGQLYRMRLDPQNLDKMKASLIYSEAKESIKVRLYGTGNDIQTINKIFLGMTAQNVKCTRLPSELHLKMDSTESSIMKTKIDLIAKDADGFYRIRIKPENLQDCYAKFYPANDSTKKGIVYLRSSEDLIGANTGQLRTLFAQNQIAAYTEKGSEKSPSIVLMWTKPNLKVDKIPLVISWTGPVSGAKELACAVQAGSTDENLIKIAVKMVRIFENIVYPISKEIEEITELVPILPANTFRRVLISTFDSIRQKSSFSSGWRPQWAFDEFLNPQRLSSWTTLIEKLLLTKYRKGATEITEEFFRVFESSQLLRIASHLRHKLNDHKQNSEEVRLIQRKAQWTFLQIARLIKSEGFEDKEFDYLCKLATKKELRPILNINYIANCATQELLLSPTHRFDFEAIIESLETNNYFDTSFHLTAPTISTIENWYVSLCLFRCLLVRNKQSIFLNLLRQIEQDPLKLKRTFQYTVPFFLKGIVDMLNEIISYPQIHPNMAIEAFHLLRNIALHNNSEHGVWTTNIEDYKKPIAILAFQYLYNFVVHPNSEVRNYACTVELDKRLLNLIPKSPRPYMDNLSVTLFTDVAKEETNLRIPPRYHTNYSEPDKNWELRKSHIPILGTSKGDKEPTDIVELIEKFIADPKARVATLQGPAGSGKTSVANGIAWKFCHQYISKSLLKHQIFYVDLATLKDPLQHLVSESLSMSIDTESPEENAQLAKEPFVLFLDGYERLDMPNEVPDLMETNKDEISRYPQAKFVFIHRADFPFKPLGEVTSIEMTPFNKEQIYSYIWHHFQQEDYRFQENSYNQTMCALDVLFEYENKGLMDLLSNPLSMRAIVQMMPYLVENIKNLYFKKISPLRFHGETLKFILTSMKNEFESELLKAHVCLIAHRETTRLSRRILLRLEEVFRFQIKFAENGLRIALPLNNNERTALGLGLKKDKKIRVLFESFLEEREGKWGFRFAIIEQYFKGIAKLIPEKQSEMLEQFDKFIAGDEYGLIWHANHEVG